MCICIIYIYRERERERFASISLHLSLSLSFSLSVSLTLYVGADLSHINLSHIYIRVHIGKRHYEAALCVACCPLSAVLSHSRSTACNACLIFNRIPQQGSHFKIHKHVIQQKSIYPPNDNHNNNRVYVGPILENLDVDIGDQPSLG